MSEEDSYRIEPRRIGMGQGMPPTPEDIERLQQRVAQAQAQNRPKPSKSFRQVMTGGSSRGGPAARAADPRPAATGRPRPAKVAVDPPPRRPSYGAAAPAAVRPTRDRKPSQGSRRMVLPAGRRGVAWGPTAKIPHGLRHPTERQQFGIRTAMLIVLKG